MTLVEHRAITPDGTVLQRALMHDYERWMPDFAACASREYAFETRLPGGDWEPAAVIVQAGRRPVVITRGTL